MMREREKERERESAHRGTCCDSLIWQPFWACSVTRGCLQQPQLRSGCEPAATLRLSWFRGTDASGWSMKLALRDEMGGASYLAETGR